MIKIDRLKKSNEFLTGLKVSLEGENLIVSDKLFRLANRKCSITSAFSLKRVEGKAVTGHQI